MARLSGWILLLALFAAYLAALAPSIYVGDSSLFAASAFSLGSAHPPGYPLYSLMGKLLTFLPLGNIAFKVNLASALFGALTCLVLYKAALDLSGNPVASLVSAALCGLSPLMFGESVKAEVYTLNSFLSMLVFYLGLRILRSEHRGDVLRHSLLGFFILGLGMGNHHTIGFMGLAFLFPVIVKMRGVILKTLALGPLAFLGGFIVNIFLYLRSLAYVLNGGLINYSFAGSLEAFTQVLLRRAFGQGDTLVDMGAALSYTGGWYHALKNSFLAVILESGGVFVPLALLGLVILAIRPSGARRMHVLAYFVLTMLVWQLVLGKVTLAFPEPSAEHVQTVSVYFMPVVPVFYALVAPGLGAFIGFFRKEKWKLLSKAVPALACLVPFVFLPYSFSSHSLSRNYLAYDYMRDMLSSMPVKSLLINYNDNTIFTAFYMKAVERYREDVLTMNTRQGATRDSYGLQASPPWKYAALFPNFYSEENSTVRELNRDFVDRGALFTSNPLVMTEVLAAHYRPYPYIVSAGLLEKDGPTAAAKDRLIRMLKENYGKLNFERVEGLPFQKDYLSHEIFAVYAYTSMVYGDLLKREGNDEMAEQLLRRAFSISPPENFLGPFVYFLMNDGRVEEARALVDELKRSDLKDYASSLEQKMLSALKETEGGRARP